MVEQVKRDVVADRTMCEEAAALKDQPLVMRMFGGKCLTALPHYLTRTETAEARVGELEGAVEAAIDTLTALRWCPPGSHCTTVSGSRIGMRPECRVCIRDYLTAKGKEAPSHA